ncbi:MAG: hypothetical protein QNJ70_03280 [Xenococcaceae cyanobacterium MO_207.B15]|nr:hypothetical protein [Xenococcaceae cyanobacterium MO_207.B15]
MINKNYDSINMPEKSQYLAQNIPALPNLSFTRMKQPCPNRGEDKGKFFYIRGVARGGEAKPVDIV